MWSFWPPCIVSWGKLNYSPTWTFGEVNILYADDFLQLYIISHLDIYLLDWSNNEKDRQEAHLHWLHRMLSSSSTWQMWQVEDQLYASLLSQVRYRCPTDDDLDLLYWGWGRPPSLSVVVPLYIIYRNNLRCAVNSKRLQHMAGLKAFKILYCIPEILSKFNDMSSEAIYSIRRRTKPRCEDVVLALIPGAPLLVTKNISSSLSEQSPLCIYIYNHLSLVNDA